MTKRATSTSSRRNDGEGASKRFQEPPSQTPSRRRLRGLVHHFFPAAFLSRRARKQGRRLDKFEFHEAQVQLPTITQQNVMLVSRQTHRLRPRPPSFLLCGRGSP